MARIAFLQDVLVEYMGFMHMSAALKRAGHTVDVFVDTGMNTRRMMKQVQAFEPDIAGFSVLTPNVPWALRTAQNVKRETRALTIFGNVHAILRPEIIEHQGVDAVCRAEGEIPLAELADRMDRADSGRDIPGLWFKGPGARIERNPMPCSVMDIEEMPPADAGLYHKYPFFKKSRTLRFLLGRGCPFHCAYCSNAALKAHFGAGYLRKKSPQRAVRELEDLTRGQRPQFVYFVDEVLWVDNTWLREFLPLYKERIGIPFSANYRYGPLEDRDVALLADAGCRLVILAVEAADETRRRERLNKRVSDKEILRAAHLLHKHGIQFNCNVMFGFPGETAEYHMGYIPFFRQINPTYLWTAFFQPYPGLALSDAPEVRAAIPDHIDFQKTFHHDMILALPDRDAITNLKKVYFLMVRFPALEPVLRRLIRRRMPFLFDLLFLVHFTYYIFKFEHVTIAQYFRHLATFALGPLLAGKNKQARPDTEQ